MNVFKVDKKDPPYCIILTFILKVQIHITPSAYVTTGFKRHEYLRYDYLNTRCYTLVFKKPHGLKDKWFYTYIYQFCLNWTCFFLLHNVSTCSQSEQLLCHEMLN